MLQLLERSAPARNTVIPMLPKRHPATMRLTLGYWTGKLRGDFQGIGVAWYLAFILDSVGYEFKGAGFLSGSATHKKNLAFGLLGDSRIDPAEGSATMTVAVNDPLPKDEDAFMRFELTDLEFASPDRLEAQFRLPCMKPATCVCPGGSGTFEANRMQPGTPIVLQ